MRPTMVCVAWIFLLVTAPSARAQGTETGASLTIHEIKNGEIAFSGPNDQFTHRFTIIATTANLVNVVAVKVPDFTDGAGKQVPLRWSWIGTPPQTIDLRTSAEILIEGSLPAPATYSTMIEIVYSSKDAAGKESIKPLRVPLRFERTAVATPMLEPELPVTSTGGDTVEVTAVYGSATAEIELVLRGTGAKSVTIDKAALVTAPRRGSGNQLLKNAVVATVKEGLPTELPRGEIRKVEVEVAGLDGPGTYEGKVLFVNSKTGASKEISFTILMRRSIALALVLIALGVCVSWRTRTWLQKDRVLARSRRDLGLLRDALSRILAGVLGDAERNAATKCIQRITELLRDIDDARNATELEADVARLWKRVALLQTVIEARKTVALIPTDDRVVPSLALESIAGALARDLDDTTLKTQQAALQSLDLEKAFRAAVTDLVRTLHRRLDERSAAHPELHARWDQIRAHVAAASNSLAHDRVLEARGSLATGYRMFTKELGTLLRQLAAGPPPAVEESRWRTIRIDIDRILEQLDGSEDVEEAAKLHARALTQFLNAAAPMLAAAARAEAKQRPVAKSEFDTIATQADALLAQAKPEADSVYHALLIEYAHLVSGTPKSSLPGGIQPAGAPVDIKQVQMGQTEVDSQLSALRAALPSTSVLSARINVSTRATDFALFTLAVLTGLQLLWIGNATWGSCGDLLASFLWGAGVYSVGQTVSRGLLGLRTDFLKTE